MVEPTKYPDIDPSLDREPGGGQRAPENPLLFAHRLLRGRYPIAIALGLVLAMIGGVAGYTALKPKFRSQGLVRVVPALPKILYETEESQVPPLFSSFVSAQATFIENRRVLDMALQDPELRSVGWPQGPGGVARLERSLRVQIPRGGQVIFVSIEDDEPRVAQEAVNAVLRAYKRLHVDESGRSKSDRQEILEQREQVLNAELRSLRDQINAYAEEFGVDNLNRLHTARVDELTELDTKIRELELMIAEGEARQGQSRSASASETPDAVPPAVMDPASERNALAEAIATFDKTMADLLTRERAIERQLTHLKASGYGPAHRQVKELSTQLTSARVQVDERIALLEDQIDSQSTAVSSGSNIEQLRALRSRYQRMRDDAQDRAEFLATRLRLISTLEDEVREKRRLLEDTRFELERVRLESQRDDEFRGRVTIASWGDMPVSPSNDKRLPAAGAGFMGGFGFGVGLVALLGLINPSCRYVDDLDRPTQSAPLLGTLPDLKSGDPEQEEMAALSVHQIRNVLELQTGSSNGRGRVFTVTSAAAGEGKTSLTMALGMSFAAAGQRTLIIDADLVGRGVTKQLQIIDKAGLREYITDEASTETCHPTPVANLYAMPTGSIAGFEPKNLSRDRTARALDRLRNEYDIVLIDTGPLMGSLEGNLVCALSDAAVLVVTRGQRSKMVQASLARIANIGGRCVGMVFNRAAADDYSRSVSHTSFHVASVRSSQQVAPVNGTLGGSRALVQAVAGTPVEEGSEQRA